MQSSKNTSGFETDHVIADKREAYNFSAGPCVLPHAVLERA